MKRRHLLLAAGLLGPALGCDSGDDGPGVPELEATYRFDVEGHLEDLFTGGAPRWPNDVEVEWPASIEIGAIQYEVEEVPCGESCWCSDDRCLTGLATAEVNGEEASGRIWYNDSSIDLLLHLRGPLGTLVDARDCDEYRTFEPYVDLHFEEDEASGTGFDYLDCQVWEGDLIVGLYNAALRTTLSEAR